MAGFFDDSDSEDESLPPVPPPLAQAGPSRHSNSLGREIDPSRNQSPRQHIQSNRTRSPSFSATYTDAESAGAAGSSRDGVRVPATDDDESSSRYGAGYMTSAQAGRGYAETMDDEMDLDATPRRRRDDADGDEALEDVLGEDGVLDDVRKLSLAWVKERGTQAIQQWEGDLMDELFDKLEQQQKMVNLLKSDSNTSEEEHFRLMLVMTEMERVKYLVRSYVRTRLAKIERFSYWITQNEELHPLLSEAELQHAQRYTELLHTHYQHSVLDSLPEWLRGMDDKVGQLDMVPKPNPDTPVLIYCKRDCGELDYRTRPKGERPYLAKGTSHLVKYHLVDRYIQLGWAEVL